MAHEGLWKQLLQLERQTTAQRAKCQYLSNPERYVIILLNTEYVVNLLDKQICSTKADSPPVPAEFLEELCILTYLINAQDLPLADKLVKAEALPGGQFFFRGLHSLPTEKLEEVLGDRPEILHQIAKQFGAKQCEFGDASIALNVLPQVPLTIVMWGKDEEFDARASILFDQTAASHLPLDALGAAVNLTIEKLIKSIGENN